MSAAGGGTNLDLFTISLVQFLMYLKGWVLLYSIPRVFPCFLAGGIGFMTRMVTVMIHFVLRDEKASRVYYI